MKHRLSALVVAALVGMAPAARADLVTNGDFETGDFTGWQVQSVHGTVSVGSLFAYAGTYGAGLEEGFGGTGEVSQQLATTAGQSYTISFYLEAGINPPADLKVYFGSDLLLDLAGAAPLGPWTKYTFTDVAASASTLLAFDFSAPGTIGWFSLDNVSVEPQNVPEPASLALLGTGLIATRFLRRLRTRSRQTA